MVDNFTTDFLDGGVGGIEDYHGDPFTYFPDGGAPIVDIIGTFLTTVEDVIEDEDVISNNETASLLFRESDVPVIKPEQDEVEIQGNRWKVMTVLGREGGMIEVMIQTTTYKKTRQFTQFGS